MLVCDGRLCFIPTKGRHLRPNIMGVPMQDISILPPKRSSDNPIAIYIREAATGTNPKRGWWIRLLDRLLDLPPPPPKSTWHVIDELDSFRETDELVH